jgi:hypothetical protein
MYDLGKHREAWIRDLYDPYIRLYGAEWVIGSISHCLFEKSVKKG